jgi:hypothetical protein
MPQEQQLAAQIRYQIKKTKQLKDGAFLAG